MMTIQKIASGNETEQGSGFAAPPAGATVPGWFCLTLGRRKGRRRARRGGFLPRQEMSAASEEAREVGDEAQRPPQPSSQTWQRRRFTRVSHPATSKNDGAPREEKDNATELEPS